MERPTASVSEFARIVGVDHAAVFRAIKRGSRLQKSVIRKDGRTRIIILEGCLEWVQNRDDRKDRSAGSGMAGVQGIMPRDQSTELDRHYAALMRQLEYGKACEELIPVAKCSQHVAECVRACRDTLQTLPMTLSELFRPVIHRILRKRGEECDPGLQAEMDSAVLELRKAARQHVAKALIQTSDAITNQIERERAAREIEETVT